MEEYAVFCGEWSDYWGGYRWQRMYGGHRALGDAQAALQLLKNLASAQTGEEEEAAAEAAKGEQGERDDTTAGSADASPGGGAAE
jgi:hypothetical protein